MIDVDRRFGHVSWRHTMFSCRTFEILIWFYKKTHGQGIELQELTPMLVFIDMVNALLNLKWRTVMRVCTMVSTKQILGQINVKVVSVLHWQ